MNRKTIRQLRGAQALGEEGLDSLVTRIEEMHRDFGRPAFAVLVRIPITREYARIVEQAERTISTGVYRSLRSTIHLLGAAATAALDGIEERLD